jgi:hypothetical protein
LVTGKVTPWKEEKEQVVLSLMSSVSAATWWLQS